MSSNQQYSELKNSSVEGEDSQDHLDCKSVVPDLKLEIKQEEEKIKSDSGYRDENVDSKVSIEVSSGDVKHENGVELHRPMEIKTEDDICGRTAELHRTRPSPLKTVQLKREMEEMGAEEHLESSRDAAQNETSVQDGATSEITSHLVKYKCANCDYVSHYKHKLFQHVMRRHDKCAEVLKCNHCNYSTINNHSLTRHYRRYHGDKAKALKCPYCDLRSEYRHSLVDHILRKHDDSAQQFECKYCYYTTKVERMLKYHVKRMHNDEAKLYKCYYCKRLVVKNRKSVLLMKQKHGDEVELCNCNEPDHEPDYTTKLRCLYCDYSTNVMTNLITHVNCEHECDVSQSANSHAENEDDVLPKRNTSVRTYEPSPKLPSVNTPGRNDMDASSNRKTAIRTYGPSPKLRKENTVE